MPTDKQLRDKESALDAMMNIPEGHHAAIVITRKPEYGETSEIIGGFMNEDDVQARLTVIRDEWNSLIGLEIIKNKDGIHATKRGAFALEAVVVRR
jgi:hypothetical protein